MLCDFSSARPLCPMMALAPRAIVYCCQAYSVCREGQQSRGFVTSVARWLPSPFHPFLSPLRYELVSGLQQTKGRPNRAQKAFAKRKVLCQYSCVVARSYSRYLACLSAALTLGNRLFCCLACCATANCKVCTTAI